MKESSDPDGIFYIIFMYYLYLCANISIYIIKTIVFQLCNYVKLNGFKKHNITNDVPLPQSLSLRWHCWQVSDFVLKNICRYTAISISLFICAFLFTQKESSCNEKLRPLNHLCVSVKGGSQGEMNPKVVPWFEENLRVTAFHHLCEKPPWACTETQPLGD